MENSVKVFVKNNGMISENYSNDKNVFAEKLINNFISILNKYKKNGNLIEEFIEKLRKIEKNKFLSTRVDFEIEKFVYFFIASLLKGGTIKDIIEIRKFQLDLIEAYHSQMYFNDIFLEKMFYNYYKDYISNLDSKTIESLKNITDDHWSIIEDDQNSYIKLLNSIHKKAYTNVLNEAYTKSIKHICFDCQNAVANKCSKVNDLTLKNINEYPYIISGYSLEKNGKVSKVVVKECDNFQCDKQNRKINNTQFDKAMEAIYEVYFDTETKKEAEQKYFEMLDKNQIVKKF